MRRLLAPTGHRAADLEGERLVLQAHLLPKQRALELVFSL